MILLFSPQQRYYCMLGNFGVIQHDASSDHCGSLWDCDVKFFLLCHWEEKVERKNIITEDMQW